MSNPRPTDGEMNSVNLDPAEIDPDPDFHDEQEEHRQEEEADADDEDVVDTTEPS